MAWFTQALTIPFQCIFQNWSRRGSLQPIFEAFTNSLESIKLRAESDPKFVDAGKIEIEIFSEESTDGKGFFRALWISDNGIGFNDEHFRRFNKYRDWTKGFNNRGSGRIQYVHFFDKTSVSSVFQEDGEYFERDFVVSKDKSFLKENAIVKHKSCKLSPSKELFTKVEFQSLLEESETYNDLDDEELKAAIMKSYLLYFCNESRPLPKIVIKYFLQGGLKSTSKIEKRDIPKAEKVEDAFVAYKRLSDDGKSLKVLDRKENLKVTAFRLNKDQAVKNDLYLVSKGQRVPNSGIELNCLGKGDVINGKRFLFLVAGDYLDKADTNNRGELDIPKRYQLEAGLDWRNQEFILLEDIAEEVETTIRKAYPEIDTINKEHDNRIDELREMFLLPNLDDSENNVSLNDSERKFLEKRYEEEAKKSANLDIAIKNSKERLFELDPSDSDYKKKLNKEIITFTREIPLQNRNSLSRYVARRRIVLDVFARILDNELKIQGDSARNIDEELLHNLIFQQSSSNVEDSDLWLLNEEFIYFKGESNIALSKITVNGVPLLRQDLSLEEEAHRKSLGEDRYLKKPDILLFPNEGKCIIVEFKNPDKNVAEHLNQISNYANILLNFSNPLLGFKTFFGFLIGEKITAFEVQAYDPGFEEALHFDYLFQTKKVKNFFNGTGDGSIYLEVIKYSTLLRRAQMRNEAFIKKLLGTRK